MASAKSGSDRTVKGTISCHPRDQPERSATTSVMIPAAKQPQSKSPAAQQQAARSQNEPLPNTSTADSRPPCASMAPIWTNTTKTQKSGGLMISSAGQSTKLLAANRTPNAAATSIGP